MSPDSRRTQGTGSRSSRGLTMQGAAVRAALAIAIALWVVLPFAHWDVTLPLLRFLIPSLFDPRTGFLPLALALFLLFAVPALLRRWSGESAPTAPRGAGPTTASLPEGAGTAEGEDPLQIPTAPFRDLGTGHRWEMAEALGIPWRDELIHDDQSWAISCLEAAQARAASHRR